jgi:signal transduction histidine kinase
MKVHEALATQRDAVMHAWKELVRGTLASYSMPTAELIDHLPTFVDEIMAALRVASEESSPGIANSTATAAAHGTQRLRLGFSLDAVVREYGLLHDAIVSTAHAVGCEPSLGELHVLHGYIIGGIADAVSEYSQQRDAELRRQANEHFAFIAHELRNPLASATMALEQLEATGLLPKHRLVEALGRGLQRTAKLVDETLNLARVASGVDLRRTSTSLRKVFADAEVGALPEAHAKGIELRVECSSDDRVELDVRLMTSAISNLVRNAIKYSNRGVVELRGRVENDRAIVEVEDCCGGLEPGKVEAAFAPFVRVDQAQTGFGLGLAIAKQAADAHGGSIRVQNLPTKGCIFVLDVPAFGPSL